MVSPATHGVDTMSKTSASNKQLRNDTAPTNHNRHRLSSKSAFSNSKQQSRPAGRSKQRKNGPQEHESTGKVLGAQHSKPKPVGSRKANSEVISRVKTDPAAAAIRRKKNFPHRQRSQTCAASQSPRVESAGTLTSAQADRRKSSASVGASSGASRKPRSRSNPPGCGHKGGRKSSRSPTCPAAYICEKHQHLKETVRSAARLSAGDSHFPELATDAEEAKRHQHVDTKQPTGRPKPTSYSIPFVLRRKPKLGEDRHAADALQAAMVHRRQYMRLRKQTSTAYDLSNNPNNCDIKVIRFHNVEIIEQHDPQMEHEGKVILKIIHKSRQLRQPQQRLDLVDYESTELSKTILQNVLEQWATVVKMWKVAGYLQQVEPYETVDFDAQLHRTSALPSTSSSTSSSPQLMERLRRSSGDLIEQHVTHDESQQTSKMVRRYLAKKGPAYQETITTQLRYNFRRKKRFYPIHLMEHVLKYKRPPFWNYSRKYRGFSVLLNKYQLEHLYELVPPRGV